MSYEELEVSSGRLQRRKLSRTFHDIIERFYIETKRGKREQELVFIFPHLTDESWVWSLVEKWKISDV